MNEFVLFDFDQAANIKLLYYAARYKVRSNFTNFLYTSTNTQKKLFGSTAEYINPSWSGNNS